MLAENSERTGLAKQVCLYWQGREEQLHDQDIILPGFFTGAKLYV